MNPDYWIKGRITGEGDCTPAALLNALKHFGRDASLDELKAACKWEPGRGAVARNAYQWLWGNGLHVDDTEHHIEWPDNPWPASDRITAKNAAYMMQVYERRFADGFVAVVSERWKGFWGDAYHTTLNVGLFDGRFRRVCHVTGVMDLRPEEWWWMDPNRYLLPSVLLWVKPLPQTQDTPPTNPAAVA